MAENNTPTNVVDDLLDGYKTIKLKITDPNGLHTRPATQLLQDVYAVGNQYGVDYPFIMKNGNLIEGGLATLLKENIKFGETLTIYMPKNIPDIKFNESKNYYKPINIPDTPGGSLGAAKLNDPLVFDSWIDNYAKTTTSFVDNLPLEKPVKDLFLNAADNRLKRLASQFATPGGILDAVDIWEMGVLALVAGAIAYNEIDEIPKIVKNTILRTYNLSQGRPKDAPLRIIGLPKIEISEYDIEFEYAMETLEKGEKVMPTEIAIDYVQEKAEEFEGEGTASGYAYMTPSAKNTDTMETTQKIQPGVQEEKMFEQARPKKIKSAGGSRARIQ